MKKEEQQLYKVLRNFEGMQKIETFDLLHKIETLLFYAKSPLKEDDLKQIIASDMNQEQDVDPFQFTILPNGNFCEFIASNDWIHIYKEMKRGISKWYPMTTYYFKTKYAPLELLKLTKKNLIENVHNTSDQLPLSEFLDKHSISKKDNSTGKIQLLEI